MKELRLKQQPLNTIEFSLTPRKASSYCPHRKTVAAISKGTGTIKLTYT